MFQTNERVAAILEQMGSLSQRDTDPSSEYRANSYKKAASVIKQLKIDIRTVEKLSELPGIGKSISSKIEEILKTGELKALSELEKKLPPLVKF